MERTKTDIAINTGLDVHQVTVIRECVERLIEAVPDRKLVLCVHQDYWRLDTSQEKEGWATQEQVGGPLLSS